MRITDQVGNLDARNGILRALERRQLPHALLLHGPPGVGKRALAQALAVAILCPTANPDACGRCSSCDRASRGTHPDRRVVEPDGRFIKVDAMRELVRSSFLRPFEGVAKVFLIFDADRCNEDSANTLLKTLEEPPDQTYLILVSHSRELVLATLRSRCQSVAMRALARSELREVLRERHQQGDSEAERRARRGQGSEETALTLDLDALAALRAEALAGLLPLAGGRLTESDADRVLKIADNYAKKDGGFDDFLFGAMRPLIRDALVIASGGGVELLVDPEGATEAQTLARALGSEGANQLLAEIDLAEADLLVNANKKLLLEALFLGVYERAVS